MVSASFATQPGSGKDRTHHLRLLDVKEPISAYHVPLTRLFLATFLARKQRAASEARAAHPPASPWLKLEAFSGIPGTRSKAMMVRLSLRLMHQATAVLRQRNSALTLF